MRGKRTALDFVLTLVVIAVFAAAGLTGLSRLLGWRFYDALLRLRPASPPAGSVVLVDVDDPALAAVGPWPWGRDALAEGLLLMKEMDARTVVLQIPLGQKGPPGVDPTALRERLPDALDREMTSIQQNIQTLFDAIRLGSVRAKDSPRYISELIRLVSTGKSRLQDMVTGVERDSDALLGQAERYFGSAYVTIEALAASDPSVSSALHDQAVELTALGTGGAAGPQERTLKAIRPPVLPVLLGARGGGFVDSGADYDGVRRRVSLTASYEDRHLSQVALAALLGDLGNPGVELRPDRMTLFQAKLPQGETRDIAIPLGEDGRMLLDWPRGEGGDGFRHLSWSELAVYAQLESSLVGTLRSMHRSGYLSYLRNDTSILDVYSGLLDLRQSMVDKGDASQLDRWREQYDSFLALTDQFLNGDAEGRILQDANNTLSSMALNDAERQDIQAARDRVPQIFAVARQSLADLRQERSLLQGYLSGAFCIVSLTAGTVAARPDRTPFRESASAGATSAAVVNTILSGRFPREAPQRVGVLLATLLCLLAAVVVIRMGPMATAGVGVGVALVVCAAVGLYFLRTNVWASPVLPAGGVAVTGLVLAGARLYRRGYQRRGMRGVFAHRLSVDSLERLLASGRGPSLVAEPRRAIVVAARLSGLPPVTDSNGARLMADLLDTCQARMGGIILELEGTIGRAEGSALLAYFGAPLGRPDDGMRACLAALRLKAAGKELGGMLWSDRIVTSPLDTRIGVDVGDCVAGVLGVAGLAGYSLSGAAVDAAEELSSLNARFGTSILVSEAVLRSAGDDFLARRLGATPVGASRKETILLELVGLRHEADEGLIAMVTLFNQAVERMEAQDWEGAEGLLQRVLASARADGPATLLLERCRARMSRKKSAG